MHFGLLQLRKVKNDGLEASCTDDPLERRFLGAVGYQAAFTEPPLVSWRLFSLSGNDFT